MCLFVRTITSERLNVGRSKLAVRYVVRKFRPSSKVKVKGQCHQGRKKKICRVIPIDNAYGVRRSYPVRSKQQQTIPLRGHPRVTGYAGGKISACCLVHSFSHSFIYSLANVNSRSRSLYAIARPSVVCLSVVCLSSVCL